jgi:hypothetical protein
LDLEPSTVKLMTMRGLNAPGVLAGVARSAPEDFRRVWGEETRADLARAIAAHLKKSPRDEGLADLLEALEEVAGKRPLKRAANLPPLSFGFVPPATPSDTQHPLPKLPKLGPRPRTNPHTGDGD